MAFTNEEFPNRVFENMDEFKACVKIRDQMRKALKGRKKRDVIVEVLEIIKKNNPTLLALIEEIERSR